MSRRTRTAVIALAVAAVLSALRTALPRARPESPVPALEDRAGRAFDGGDYATALPILVRLESDLTADPAAADRLAVVRQQIRVCQRNQVAAMPPVPPPSLSAGRKPHPLPADGQVLDLTILQLGNFDYDPDQDTLIPADVRSLSGHTVRLHGYMVPMEEAQHITRFALVPSLFNCCALGGPPQVQHTVVVACPMGKPIAYYPDELVVEGKLAVEAIRDEGFIVGIFAVDAASVRPAAK